MHALVDGIAVRVHKCSVCGKVEEWGPTWLWYGSMRDDDDGVDVPKFCSVECASSLEDSDVDVC